jgi:hypothetical protein
MNVEDIFCRGTEEGGAALGPEEAGTEGRSGRCCAPLSFHLLFTKTLWKAIAPK